MDLVCKSGLKSYGNSVSGTAIGRISKRLVFKNLAFISVGSFSKIEPSFPDHFS